jgi:H+/gluconate symporter-like permease
MSPALAGVLLLLTYALFVYYVIKGGNLMLGFLGLGILWAIIGGIPFKTFLNETLQAGMLSAGNIIITVMLGSWFGRVLSETGITAQSSARRLNWAETDPSSYVSCYPLSHAQFLRALLDPGLSSQSV